MTKVDFYTGSTDKLRTACLLSHKAMQNGLRTAISLPDDGDQRSAGQIALALPGNRIYPPLPWRCEDADQMPVVLNHGSDKFPHHDLLISLHDECVPFFSRFERVIEIVSNDAGDASKGRERFKFYRDRGYELRHIDLTSTQAV